MTKQDYIWKGLISLLGSEDRATNWLVSDNKWCWGAAPVHVMETDPAGEEMVLSIVHNSILMREVMK